ncbi:hypothetical protein FACS1894167_07200 [Synergistales bacterium]|nr:hypothetical protein FACS1894167_07200 [Synergistales bacterium]
MDNNMQSLYANRFDGELESKNAMWRVLCRHFFQKYVNAAKQDGSLRVADVAAGYCEWINNIEATEKYAVDMNPDTAKFAADGVKSITGGIDALAAETGSGYFDCVFMSNFLEHLNSKEEVQTVVTQAWQMLRDGGRLMILQPNIKYVGGKYWDFFDHKTPLTEQSLTELVDMIRAEGKGREGKGTFVVKRFLPYTTKSALPKSPWLIRLYLLLMPISGWIFGEQSFMIFER